MNNKNIPTVFGDAETIRDAVQKMAWQGVINPQTKAPYSSAKVTGFVAKINTDGDLAGTVDVQEYMSYAREARNIKEGYHEGVFLSALQNNDKGILIVPMLYSEVVIMKDPSSGNEYVVMVSHVDIINLDSHQTIAIGVKEREEFDPNGDVELEDMEETGVYSKTIYEKNKVETEVVGSDGADPIKESFDYTGDDPKYTVIVGEEDKISVDVGGKQIKIERGSDGSLVISDSETTIKSGSSKVKVEDGCVYVGSDSNTDVAVLGNALADVLLDFIGYMTQMQTTTQLGPQPPLNLASFIALKAKVQAYKSSTSGFLTQKVKIQK